MAKHLYALPLFAALLLLAACAAPAAEAPVGDEAPPTDAPAAPDVTFALTGENFKFVMGGQDNPELRVKAGDVVRIEFTSTDGFHDFVVDEFGAKTERVQTGGSTSVEFVAGTPGMYEYYCSVGQHRANGMRGTLIVE